MAPQQKMKRGSNRSFGLVFFLVFFIIALWPLINGEDFSQIRNWPLYFSLVFLILGLMNSKLLTPLNKLWFKFGMLLGSIIAPIVMAIVFFFVVTPVGVFMRIIGKDLLKKKYEKNIESYWIKKDKAVSTMKQQF